MFKHKLPRFTCFLLLSPLAALAQQPNPPAEPASHGISLDVVVTPKSGPPISGLTQQDFTVLDNKVPQPISSFRAVRSREAPLEFLIVLDDVNAGVSTIAFERTEVEKFLHNDGGRLAYPTALGILTDAGIKITGDFANDGNALSTVLDQYTVGLHSILRSGGIYSAVERFQVSLTALLQLADHEAQRPGRKIILWISPGWPLLSSAGVQEQMTPKQREQIFNQVVQLSNALRQARITLYSIDPRASGSSLERDFRWKTFQKGLSKQNDAEWGDLGLQVVVTQSGGIAFPESNDITSVLQKCVADSETYYELSFVPPSDSKPNEYHHIEVRVAKGTTARTRDGYYSQP
jgi:VWFA-related protein